MLVPCSNIHQPLPKEDTQWSQRCCTCGRYLEAVHPWWRTLGSAGIQLGPLWLPRSLLRWVAPWSDWLKKSRALFSGYSSPILWGTFLILQLLREGCNQYLSLQAVYKGIVIPEDSFGVTIWHQSGWWRALLTLFTFEGHIQSCDAVLQHMTPVPCL